MHQVGSFNTSCQIRTDSHHPVSHLSSVTAATPAKRITFFKSGDPQFSGVRMAIHKRSFKCFDALLDDLSQKVPLPFGVRTITTPRGTHSIQHLDQLKDGGCYLCSDRQYVKPINMEAAGRQPVVWNYKHPHNTRKKPSRPEEPPVRQSGQHYNRHLKSIVLVKNSDPAVRRSIILSRRMARSLRVFMDEISELMQCHVRKLYTLEGRKIDSIQSLLQSPSVLVCVGREAFKPLLLENLWKHSEEKLPELRTRSHSSTCSDGHESKKNVNFGLETKKSIIHPRSDSSNKSTRFSLSSEKSYPNGSGMTRQPGGIPKEVIRNDDIEKRVFVNKDGSLAVEMKVRFRLVNDETLQWSTEIKKLPSNTNEMSFLKGRDSQYLQDKVEYSDPEYHSTYEAEEACASNVHPKHLHESCCQNRCSHSQGYDIWKNPAHKDNGTKSSSRSTGSSHKIMHNKASVDSVCTSSRSSEEYTEHVVEKASCFEQTVEEGKTKIKYCSVSRCCSRSEVTATTLNCNIPTDDSCESNTGNICQCQIRTPNFTECNQKDQDYYVSNWSQSNPEHHTQCIDCYNRHAPGNVYLSPVPSAVSSCSTHASKPTKHRCIHRALVQHQQKAYPDINGTDSTRSLEASRYNCCHCNCQGETTPTMVTSDRQSGLGENTQITEYCNVSDKSRTKENAISTVVIDVNDAQENDCKYIRCANTNISEKSSRSTVCTCSGGKKSSTQSENVKVKSCKCSHYTSQTDSSSLIPKNIKPVQNHRAEVEVIHNGCDSAMSDLSDVSTTLKQSDASNPTACERSLSVDFTDIKEISKGIMSEQSNAQENVKSTEIVVQALDINSQEQVPSTMPAKAYSSKESQRSYELTNNIKEHATTSPTASSPGLDTFQENKHSEKSSATSRCSKVSDKSNACSERDSKSVLKHRNTSADVKTRQETSAHFLPVSSPSPKMKTRFSTPSTPKSLISIGANNRAQNTKSVNSKASLISGHSSKCHCLQSNGNVQEGNDQCGQRVANSLQSPKSPTPSSLGQSNEPLSPTSTASVSLGFGEDEGSMSSKSEILNKNRCPSKKYAPEPAPESSTIVKSKHRDKTATSASSTISVVSKLSHVLEDQCKNLEQATETHSMMSASAKQEGNAEILLNDEDERVPPGLSVNSCPKSQCSGSQLNEINSDAKENEGGQAVNGTSSKSSSISGQIELTSGKTTPAGASKDRAHCTTKSNRSSSNLGNKQSNKTGCYSNDESFKSDKKTCEQEERNSVVKMDVSQNCATPVDETANRSIPPTIHLNLSGADLLNEKPVKGRTESRGSRSNLSSTTNKHRKISTILQHKAEKDQLMPSSLPSASPTEVINNWLRNIPHNSPTYEMEEDFIDKHDEAVHQIPAVKEEEHLQNEMGETEKLLEIKPQIKDFQLTESRGEDPFHPKESIICGKSKLHDETQIIAANADPILAPELSKKEGLTNHCQSSIHVMKVLLNPKLDRCNSLPDVSSTYGRKLSTSAKELIDCLANLQIIDSDLRQDKGDRYNEILSIIQSLWLCEHSKTEHDKPELNDQHSAEEECNPKSSSGVDLSIGSIGSAKGSTVQSKTAQSTITLIAEQTACLQTQEDTVIESKDDYLTATPVNISHGTYDPLTPDIAERVRCSPEDNKPGRNSQKEATEEVTKDNKNTEFTEIFSNTSSDNDSNAFKSLANKNHDSPEDTKSGTSSSGQTGELTKRVSQDPDPVWVLGLLKKIENQFMSHYANAIAEFKVKWDLNDNETLDTMICELKEEVHKRIQSTINRELQKIQGRAGRAPRPPMSTLSRDSSVQTEQRRRRLKVMQNKLVNLSLSRSEDVNTASGTELSEQRSDDEYCPCDTCMKKKMECRVVRRAEASSLAPVLMDFDLKKILQKKKDLPETTPMQGETKYSNGQDTKNLEVVHEEDEVHHIKSQKDKNKTDAAAVVIHTRYKNVPVNVDLASENQDTEVVVSSNGAEAVQNLLFDDGNKRQEALEEELNKTREKETEIGEESSVESTNNKDEGEKNRGAVCTVDEMSEKKAARVEKETQEETAIDLQTTENDQPDEEAEIETENSEHREEQKDGTEWETCEKGQKEDSEEKAALMEVEVTEEERESVQVCKTSAEQLSETQDGNERSNMETQYECEKINEDSETCNENQAPSEAEEDSDEGTKPKEFKQHEDGVSEEGLATSVQVHEEGEDKQGVELEDGETNQNHKDINEVEKPTHYSKIDSDQNQETKSAGDSAYKLSSDNINAGETEDSDCRLFQQVTKTSVESQPGSLECCKDLKKLNDIYSFMESAESQDDSMVGISRQSVFLQGGQDSSRHSNRLERKNVSIQCQVSDTIRRTSASTNKQTSTKEGDLEVDNLDF